jgi:hypothetical protein
MSDDVAAANDDQPSAMDEYVHDLKEGAEFCPTAAIMLEVFKDMDKFGAVRSCGPDYNGAVYFAAVKAMLLCGIFPAPYTDRCARILADVIGEVWDASHGTRFNISVKNLTVRNDEGLRWPSGQTFPPPLPPRERDW